jgi:hypothetical protein
LALITPALPRQVGWETALVTNEVAAATGRPPRSFAAFAQREFGA